MSPTIKLKGIRNPVAVADILYIKSDGAYSQVKLISGKTLLISINLAEFTRRYAGFVRSHRYYVVNPAYVVRCHTPTYEGYTILTLQTGNTLPVGRKWMKPTMAQFPRKQSLTPNTYVNLVSIQSQTRSNG